MPGLDERIELAARSVDAVRHTLGGPLQTALNALFLLRREGRDGENVAQLGSALGQLRQRLDRLALLTEALRPPTLVPVTLAALAEQALAALDAGRARVTLELETPTADVDVDLPLVAASLGELVKNGLRCAEASAEVTLRLEATSGRGLRARVDSPGAKWPEGIDQEQAVDPLFTTRGASMGIGLSVAWRVAAAHGAQLRLHSSEAGTAVEWR